MIDAPVLALDTLLPGSVEAARFEDRLADEAHPDRDPVVSMRRRVRARSRSYRATLPREAKGLLPDDATAVLARLGEARAAAIAAQVAELGAAVDWAALHVDAAHHTDAPGGEQLVQVAGEGAPLVAEFAIPELALRLGVSTDTGRHLLADAVELAHRLPRCWAALHAGDVPVFKARRVAQATRELNPAAAAFVDAEVAPYLHGLGTQALDQIVERAIWTHDLEVMTARADAARDRRGLDIDLDTLGSTCQVDGRLDRADAVELERAVSQLAHQLSLAGSTDPLDVRRSQALGMIARREDPIAVPDLTPPASDSCEWDPEPSAEPAAVFRRRDTTLHVHLRLGSDVAHLEGHHGPISLDLVRSWCAAPGSTTRVTVRPVVDLAAVVVSDAYAVPDDLADLVATRDRTCVFPHCTRDARRCDVDHVTAWDDGGETASDNLAALCRRHHRVKTHHPGWTYRVLHPGTYLWTSPHGQRVLRDPTGTHALH